MRRREWILVLTAGCAFGAFSARSLTPIDEESFGALVRSHRGRVLLVDFWATWCAPCREELPNLVALHTARKQKGFDFVTVSCDEPEQEDAAATFLDQQRVPEPRYIRRVKSDDAFIDFIDPKWSGALPALFLFDRMGRRVQSIVGEVDIKQVDARIAALLSAS